METIDISPLGTHEVCLTKGSKIRIADTSYENGSVIAYKYDQKMYFLHPGETDKRRHARLIPNTDTAMIFDEESQHVSIVANFSKKLDRHRVHDYTYYTYGDLGEPIYSMPATNIVYGQIFPSRNGEHIAYVRLNQRRDNFEFVTVGLTTGEEKLVGIPEDPLNYADLLFKNMTVSNDGRYMAANMLVPLYTDNDGNGYGGQKSVVKIWQLDNCLISYDTQPGDGLIGDVCESRVIDEQLEHISVEDRYSDVYSMEFYSDNSELSLFHRKDRLSALKRTVISLPNFKNVPPLGYLALGDSYSSGEGDIRGRGDPVSRHYLEETNVSGDINAKIPEEKCHISPLSYPFRLQSMLDIPVKDMGSVACSGATRVDIEGWSNVFLAKEGSDVGYRGQSSDDNPRLAMLESDIKIKQYQNDAYTNFIPGRIQQIEFVRKYKPKAITITTGGNDIGFPDVLRECTGVLTCHYAGDKSLKSSGAKIDSMYVSLRDMYIALKQASPETKIYAVGYPQFISTALYFCMSTPVLDSSERTMIKNGVSYLNNVIKAAASAANIYYIDIENSLGDHKLCEPSLLSKPYVNGLLTAIFLEEAESFHPDHNGHHLIADQISKGLKNQSLLDFNKCENNYIIYCPRSSSAQKPKIPNYFNPQSAFDRITKATNFLSLVYDDVKPDVVPSLKRSTSVLVTFHSGTLEALSNGWAELHSTPVKLSEFTTNNDGSLNTTVNIPHNTPLGYHTIHVIAKSHSGEPIDLFQTIKVISDNPNDTDNDGINNNQDTCEFILEKGLDRNNNNIDDACDFIGGSSPEQLDNVPQAPKKDDAVAPPPIIARFEPNSTTMAKYIDAHQQNKIIVPEEPGSKNIDQQNTIKDSTLRKDNATPPAFAEKNVIFKLLILSCLGILSAVILVFICNKLYNRRK